MARYVPRPSRPPAGAVNPSRRLPAVGPPPVTLDHLDSHLRASGYLPGWPPPVPAVWSSLAAALATDHCGFCRRGGCLVEHHYHTRSLCGTGVPHRVLVYQCRVCGYAEEV